MKKVDLNEAKFGDQFIDEGGKLVIYNKKRKGYHELLKESTGWLCPYTDDGWERYYIGNTLGNGSRPILTKNIPKEQRCALTGRIAHADDIQGQEEISKAYRLALAKLLESL